MSVVVTLAGQALFAAASAGGDPVQFYQMAVGDGAGSAVTPLETATALINEVYRVGLQSVTVDPAQPNIVLIEAVIPNVAGPFTIREVGLYDADGVFVAHGRYPATDKLPTSSGTPSSITVQIALVFASAANVSLTLTDDTFATQEWVEANFVRKPGPFLFYGCL